jgi:hypothetical protein
MHILRRIIVRSFKFVQAFWMIIGVSLAMLLVAESCYRAASAAGDKVRSSRATPAPRGPFAGVSWYRDFSREFDATRALHWQPYVYFRRSPSYHGRYVNVDSLGRRITPQPSTPAKPSARVFFFGGSTMWGSFQRDDHTIPAEASRRLQQVAGPGARIEVRNFGETGWVMTQEMLELMLQLRSGARPDVVVFYDGINDAFSTLQYGVAGIPQNEEKRAAEFAMGRKLDRSLYGHGLASDLRAVGTLGLASLEHLELVQRLQSIAHPTSVKTVAVDSAARALTAVYAENVRLIEALAKAYGFTPIYVWQPSLHATGKRVTPYEARLLQALDADPFQHRLRELHRIVPRMLDLTMGTVAPGRFIDDVSLFTGDTVSVFVDQVGHNAEQSVPAIVESFWPALQQAVAPHLATAPIAPASPSQRR